MVIAAPFLFSSVLGKSFYYDLSPALTEAFTSRVPHSALRVGSTRLIYRWAGWWSGPWEFRLLGHLPCHQAWGLHGR
jgi:hypothetical protein